MYKNASTIINDKIKGRPSNENIARNTIALSRISAIIQHTGNMVHFSNQSAHADVALPPLLTGKAAGDEEETKQTYSTLARDRGTGLRRGGDFGLGTHLNRSSSSQDGDDYTTHPGELEKKVLDREKIMSIMNKVKQANDDSIPDWEKKQDRFRFLRKQQSKRELSSRKGATHEVLVLLERKLKNAMKSVHQELDTSMEDIRKNLKTRDLLPHYKIGDLRNFLEIFQKVDDDYSGDLDIEEWSNFFAAFNKAVTQHQARLLFSKIDQDGDGFLSVRDLIPVIFSKANKEQGFLIEMYLKCELSKRKVIGKEYVVAEDLETIFEYYDSDLIGFVAVHKIKEKIRSFQLPDAAHIAIFNMFKEYEDDEMLNMSEFTRLFQPYINLAGA